MAPKKADFGALNPIDATEAPYHNGLHHLYEPTQLTFLKNVYGGLLFGFADLFALIAATGSSRSRTKQARPYQDHPRRYLCRWPHHRLVRWRGGFPCGWL